MQHTYTSEGILRFAFERRGKTVVYQQLDSVVAVRPVGEAVRPEGAPPAKATAARMLKQLHMTRAPDDSHGPTAALPARSRRVFEKAGWAFAKARPDLQDAALTRVPHAAADIRPVLVDAAGNTVIGTSCLVVELRPDIRADHAEALLQADGLTLVRTLRFGINLFEVQIRPGLTVQEVLDALRSNSNYVFADPTFIEVVAGRNDPDLPKQWHHENPGGASGKAGADVKSKVAWKHTRGKGVRIAIIDNGMQVNHPDLMNQIDSGGEYGLDGTCGGEFRPYKRGDAFRDDTHGTFCMGLAAAEGDNGTHGCGVAPEARLMAIACAFDQIGTQITLARAVAFAADPTTEAAGLTSRDGADVLSCSLGAGMGNWLMSNVLERAICFAAKTGRLGRGLPIFWASSNQPADIDNDEVCSAPEVIAVGASSSYDFEAGGAFGDKLAFLAPGLLVYSTISQSGFDRSPPTGATSYACPVAAAVAALVLSVNPTLTRDQVVALLKDNCDRIGPSAAYVTGHSKVHGHGRLNAASAVRAALPPLNPLTAAAFRERAKPKRAKRRRGSPR